MSNFREYMFHFFTIVMIFLSIFFVIPNLSSDLKNYESEIKTIESSRIDENEYTSRYGDKRIEHTLIIIMTDKTELEFSDSEYSKYFEELQNKKYIGKKIKYYLANYTAENMNPIQVEIENKIIYDTSESCESKYFLLLLTLGFSIYSGYKLREYLKIRKTN